MEQLRNPMIEWLSKVYNFVIAHKKEFIAGLIIFVGATIFSLGYLYHKSRLQEKAYKSFANALRYYDAKVGEAKSSVPDIDLKSFATAEEKWNEVAKIFQEGFENYRNAGIAPFFLVYQSDALLNLGKTDEAINVLRQAIDLMKNKSATYSYFKIKLALMLIDSKKDGSENEGLEILKEFARDSKNPANDLALYRLGEYFWFAKNYFEAENYWNQLNVSYGKKSLHPSAWAAQARERLKLITTK
jgi:tetratricopeptide (TPR) repeat protein